MHEKVTMSDSYACSRTKRTVLYESAAFFVPEKHGRTGKQMNLIV